MFSPAHGRRVATSFVLATACCLLCSSARADEPNVVEANKQAFEAAMAILDTVADHLKKLEGYSCMLVTRQRVAGELGEYEYIQLKVQQQPYRYRMLFLASESIEGNAVYFDEMRKNGEATQVRLGRSAWKDLLDDPNKRFGCGSTWAPPTLAETVDQSRKALRKNQPHSNFGVTIHLGAKLNGRQSTAIDFRRTNLADDGSFYSLRVMIDDELKIPCYFATYDKLAEAGGPARLLEEYALVDFKPLESFTDDEFQPPRVPRAKATSGRVETAQRPRKNEPIVPDAASHTDYSPARCKRRRLRR